MKKCDASDEGDTSVKAMHVMCYYDQVFDALKLICYPDHCNGQTFYKRVKLECANITHEVCKIFTDTCCRCIEKMMTKKASPQATSQFFLVVLALVVKLTWLTFRQCWMAFTNAIRPLSTVVLSLEFLNLLFQNKEQLWLLLSCLSFAYWVCWQFSNLTMEESSAVKPLIHGKLPLTII